jgi:long-chain acyl-CoA synthetase
MLAEARDDIARHPWVSHYPSDVPTHLDYPAEPAYWLLEEAARKVPDRIAVRHRRETLTYSELLTRSRRMASALRARGLRPGERVALLMPNMPEYLVSLFGTWIAGGAVVPLNPLMVGEEVVAFLQATE